MEYENYYDDYKEYEKQFLEFKESLKQGLKKEIVEEIEKLRKENKRRK